MQNGSPFSARDRQLLQKEGWIIISEKPLEIRGKLGSVATKIAALEILVSITQKYKSSTRKSLKKEVDALIKLVEENIIKLKSKLSDLQKKHPGEYQINKELAEAFTSLIEQ